MNPRSHDLWIRVEELFHAAQQQPTGARDAWVDLHEESIEVRNEVKSLLAGFETQEKRGQGGAASQNTAAGVAPLPSARFGPYRLIKLIGRGGMGSVYLARRADGQFDRTVALKMMAAHLSGDEFLARFHRERQLLASLEHPHITRLLDGGVFRTGRARLVGPQRGCISWQGRRGTDQCGLLRLAGEWRGHPGDGKCFFRHTRRVWNKG